MIKILNETECFQLLQDNYIGHLTYIYNNRPFIAPITYYYDKTRNIIIGYSAKGHKITAMRAINTIAMEVAEIDTVTHWNTIVVHGTYEELEGSTAKAYLHDFSLGVKDLIFQEKKQKPDFIYEFSSKITKGDFPVIFLIHIEEITGRMRSS